MATPGNYRRRARHSLTLAEWASEEAIRQTYMDLAARWQALAERQERGESLEEIAGMPRRPKAVKPAKLERAMHHKHLDLIEVREKAFAAREKAARARRVASQSADPVPFEEHAVELENRAAELERRRERLDAELQ